MMGDGGCKPGGADPVTFAGVQPAPHDSAFPLPVLSNFEHMREQF